MKLLLTPHVTRRLLRELRRAKDREIGGVLMGEHIVDDVFRLVEISVQRTFGSAASFTRNPNEHQPELAAFFARTGEDFTRFNYLGEWHSHPGFDPIPSSTDIRSMQSIAEDPAVGANFVVLLIISLAGTDTMTATAHAFRPGTEPTPALLVSKSISGIE
jgi:[CysO sulfur-carrier protein]-S-L-cysteine hydrolase